MQSLRAVAATLDGPGRICLMMWIKMPGLGRIH
jgi:hypothetical protein